MGRGSLRYVIARLIPQGNGSLVHRGFVAAELEWECANLASELNEPSLAEQDGHLVVVAILLSHDDLKCHMSKAQCFAAVATHHVTHFCFTIIPKSRHCLCTHPSPKPVVTKDCHYHHYHRHATARCRSQNDPPSAQSMHMSPSIAHGRELLMFFRYDLHSTLDVVVGSETFSLHTSIFAERSEFFRAARKPEWLTGDPKKPVDLKDEDAEIFGTYINCVYFEQDVLTVYADECDSCPESDRYVKANVGFQALVRLYILSDKLQDLATANIAIDEIIRFSDITQALPANDFSHVYGNTPPNSPLRVLLRDYFVYERDLSSAANRLDDLPPEALKDIMLEVLRTQQEHGALTVEEAFSKQISANMDTDRCYYHQHDDSHPRCASKPSSE